MPAATRQLGGSSKDGAGIRGAGGHCDLGGDDRPEEAVSKWEGEGEGGGSSVGSGTLIMRAGASEMLAALIPHCSKREYWDLYQEQTGARRMVISQDLKIEGGGQEAGGRDVKEESDVMTAEDEDEEERLSPELWHRLEVLSRLPSPRSVLLREGVLTLSRCRSLALLTPPPTRPSLSGSLSLS